MSALLALCFLHSRLSCVPTSCAPLPSPLHNEQKLEWDFASSGFGERHGRRWWRGRRRVRRSGVGLHRDHSPPHLPGQPGDRGDPVQEALPADPEQQVRVQPDAVQPTAVAARAALRGDQLRAARVGVRQGVVQLHRPTVPAHQLGQYAHLGRHRHRQVGRTPPLR